MNPIDLEPTSTTPAIYFEADKLIIKGRSIPLHEAKFYDPFIAWAATLEAQSLSVDVYLEYMNSSSSKKLLHLLKNLDTNTKISALKVNWYFEDGDDETLEHGRVFEKLLKRVEFSFIKVNDNN